MIDYLYDGTFEGLLTCVYAHYYDDKANGIFLESQYQNTLLGESMVIASDGEKAKKVYVAIKEKISEYDLQRIYKVYRSSVDNKEMKILNYIRLGFAKGFSVSNLHGNPIVHDLQSAELKINNEIHRLKGLIRFISLENSVLYSPIEPNHDVVEFLAPHFCDRLKNEAFVIHDLKRKKALISAESKWYISDFQIDDVLELEEKEMLYQTLWKEYFNSIAIKERTNSRCQKNFMPIRYWKHLTEMQ